MSIMKFAMRPTLERIALVKIVVSLWNQNDVRTSMGNLHSPLHIRDEVMNLHSLLHFTDKVWQKIEDRVIEKVTQLLIPELLKEKLIGFVKPIGLQILEWKLQNVYQCFHLHADVSAEICWTLQGTIDRKKTAEVLINDDNLDISKRFLFASHYCLEGSIPELWKKMPKTLRESILDCEDLWTYELNLVSVWAHAIEKGWYNKHSSYQYLFEYAAAGGTKVATEYFLQKLTPREREESLVPTAKLVLGADVLIFLLLQMDQDQQIEVLKCNPCEKLLYFLEWPFQTFFMETANLVWEFLCSSSYVALLERIVEKINSGYKDYKKLFCEFVQKSPNTHFIKDEFLNNRLLSLLFRIKDKEIIFFILKNGSPALKEKLMCCNSAENIFLFFISEDNWDLLEMYIQLCVPSKDQIIKFKKEFEYRIECCFHKNHVGKNKQQWDQLFNLIDMYGKRSIEEGETSSSKRLRKLQ